MLFQVVRGGLHLNSCKGAQQVCQLLHPAGPVIMSTAPHFLAFHWRKGWTTMLIVNSSSKRKKSRKSFSLTIRKAVAMYCCHGTGKQRKQQSNTGICTSSGRKKGDHRFHSLGVPNPYPFSMSLIHEGPNS